MLRKMNDERQLAREQPHRRSRIKYARLPLYGYNIGAGVTWEGGRRGMAAAAMVGGMSLVSNCVVCDIFFEGARAQIQNGVQSMPTMSITLPIISLIGRLLFMVLVCYALAWCLYVDSVHRHTHAE